MALQIGRGLIRKRWRKPQALFTERSTSDHSSSSSFIRCSSLLQTPSPSQHSLRLFSTQRLVNPLLQQSESLIAPSATGFNDYHKEKESFSIDVPEYYNFANDTVDAWAEVEKVTFNS